MNTVDKVVNLVNELQEIADNNWMQIIVGANRVPVVHISLAEKFFSFFEQYDIDPEDGETFSHQVSVEIEGVRFIAFLTPNDYKKYVLKSNERVS